MEKQFEIPQFTPYETINFCHNIVSVRFLISGKNFYPLFIGKDTIPKVWIYSKIDGVVLPIVENNIAKTPQVRVNIDNYITQLSVNILDLSTNTWVDMLKIDYRTNIPNVYCLNLKPIGYDIYGDNGSLNVGKQRIYGNSISGFSLIGIG